jgi:hypothetical protein
VAKRRKKRASRRSRRVVASAPKSVKMTISPSNVSISGGKIGDLAFGLGVLLALILGFGVSTGSSWASKPHMGFILLILGLIVGVKNIRAKEVGPFLLGSIALMMATALSNLVVLNFVIPGVGTFIKAALGGFIMMVAPAALIVSFKAVYKMAK